MSALNHSITVSVMGEVESGKTSLIRRLTMASFTETQEDETFPTLDFKTNHGFISINLVESELPSTYTIFVFDGSDLTFFNERIELAVETVGNNKTLFVVNKIDRPLGLMQRDLLLFSAKSCTGYSRLVNDILRTVTGKDDVKIVCE